MSQDPDQVRFQSAVHELESAGYGVIPPQQYCSDMESVFIDIWNKVEPYTMISIERAYSLYLSVRYIIRSGIRGDFAECGVWKGGAAMLMALTMIEWSPGDLRRIYLFDTFRGMTEPGEEDRVAWNSRPVREKWEEDRKGEKNNFGWWAVCKDDVIAHMKSIGYPDTLYIPVEGDVLETIPEQAPSELTLLRLDTDWYESTAHELRHLYPRLHRGGILLIDDYGHFTGARQAVDEYFADKPVFLHRDDYTGRSLVKCF